MGEPKDELRIMHSRTFMTLFIVPLLRTQLAHIIGMNESKISIAAVRRYVRTFPDTVGNNPPVESSR